MAKPATTKLKVFQAQFGFYDTVVAAPSRPAALRAWGVHQNLFASGQARVADDAGAIKAALAHPETPLKRALGSRESFGLEASLPTVPDASKQKAAKPRSKARQEPLSKPPADRSALDKAEAALKTFYEDRKREEAALHREQEALDAKKAAAQETYVAGRKAASAALVEARQSYRKAAGAT